MPSSKEFLDFVLTQLSALPDITYRAMMGEYIIYYRGKIIGGIYDNRLLIKPTTAAQKIIPNATPEIPYPGAKPMYLVEELDNKPLLTEIAITTLTGLAKK